MSLIFKLAVGIIGLGALFLWGLGAPIRCPECGRPFDDVDEMYHHLDRSHLS